MNDRPEEPIAEPIPVAQFEGEFVRVMEGKLPPLTLGMEAGYARGTHLKLELEVRVRNVRYEEITSGQDKGELKRQHIFAIENQVLIVGAYTPEELDPGVGGSASAAAIGAEPEDDDDEEGFIESVNEQQYDAVDAPEHEVQFQNNGVGF